MDKKKETKDKKIAINNVFIGTCPAHNWEGFRRDNYNDAALDLEGHLQYFPDEDHNGARVIQN